LEEARRGQLSSGSQELIEPGRDATLSGSSFILKEKSVEENRSNEKRVTAPIDNKLFEQAQAVLTRFFQEKGFEVTYGVDLEKGNSNVLYGGGEMKAEPRCGMITFTVPLVHPDAPEIAKQLALTGALISRDRLT
jgi:hypothetical protein